MSRHFDPNSHIVLKSCNYSSTVLQLLFKRICRNPIIFQEKHPQIPELFSKKKFSRKTVSQKYLARFRFQRSSNSLEWKISRRQVRSDSKLKTIACSRQQQTKARKQFIFRLLVCLRVKFIDAETETMNWYWSILDDSFHEVSWVQNQSGKWKIGYSHDFLGTLRWFSLEWEFESDKNRSEIR
jgi:hypothetical protein